MIFSMTRSSVVMVILLLSSFSRKDTRTEFSAADVAYAANALLEECILGDDDVVNEHVALID